MQKQISAVQPQQIGRRGVPEILADQHADPAKAGIEGAHRVAPGKKTALVEQGVGGQVHLAVHVQHLAARQISRGDVEAVAFVLLDKADHQVDFLAGFQQRLEDRVVGVGTVRQGGHQVLQHIAGERQFRENQQVGTLAAGFFGDFQVFFQVGLDIAQYGVDL